MALVSRITRRLHRALHGALLTPGELRRLAAHDHLLAPAVARALAACRAGPLAGEDAERAQAIEARRREVCASTRVIRMVDFGAGAPEEGLEQAQMDAGRTFETTVGEMATRGSKLPHWCRLLHRLVRECRPERCLEMGTCAGISGSYQAAALALNGTGRLVSLEGAPDLAEVSRETFANLGLTNAEVRVGPFHRTLAQAISDLAPLEYVFVDGHHDEAATWDYFEKIHPHLALPALLVFDDIGWSEGMRRAWDRIAADPRVAFSVDLFHLGIVVTDDDGAPPATFRAAVA